MTRLLTWGSGFAARLGVVSLSHAWIGFGAWQMAVAVFLFWGGEYSARKDAGAKAVLAPALRRVK